MHDSELIPYIKWTAYAIGVSLFVVVAVFAFIWRNRPEKWE